MRHLIATICFLAFSLTAAAQKKETPETQYEMKKYYLVLLKRGPEQGQDSATLAALMKEHLAHLERMYNENKMSMCGPLAVDNEIRGICVYHIDDIEEVRRLAGSDPAVKAGRLTVQVLPWYTAKGMILK
ncbi:hypothetical protein GCM10023093_15380 [Nemorincola caseinilytica]|uniref:YCII-related domain-containing protein n=1 Tax=Nemorincola caseinilytica TaxID=2054315 RepID=A0ABP8NBZ9_9BACT